MPNYVCSGYVQNPVVRSSLSPFGVEAASSQNALSTVGTTLTVNSADCVSGTSELSDVQPLSCLQIPSTSSHSSCEVEPDCQPSQPAREKQLTNVNDELSSYALCASPQPNECLNDIWLSSAAVGLGSPIMSRSSGSHCNKSA